MKRTVTVDHRLEADEVPAFRARMEQQRRAEGALRWELFANLEEPGHYREVYTLPAGSSSEGTTWVDCL